MKKYLHLAIALLALVNGALAHPVDLETAQKAGRQFALTSFNNMRQQPELQWVYTGASERGAACFHVFNVDQSGFVIISADDRFRPVVGYSDEGVFDTKDPSPELMYYLDRIIEARTSPDAVLPEGAEADWQALLSGGKMRSRNEGRAAQYLCQTKWNQNSPYNYYSPAASSGPGGRCYAGCVATAMSQLMKYWDHPANGTGSHGYYSSYGYLSANFGQTQYQWELMPNRLGSNQEQIEAVALLMYHCGVAVNMAFSPNGSGAFSDDVPAAIRNYFSYTNQTLHRYRDEFTLVQWQNRLKEQFDLGWPVYYCGYSDSGGHAFVCDGYDDNDLFHFNWGWGGSSDGWFVIDEIDYANWSSAIFNFVPSHVYQYSPAQPSDFTVETLGDSEFTAVLHWTNPSQTIHGSNLTTLDRMVLTRNGRIIQTFENAAPGQAMTYTDHFLPSVVRYAVYGVSHDAKGAEVVEQGVALGPSTYWTVEMSAPDAEGWKGGGITVRDGMGVEIATLSPNALDVTATLPMPIGPVSFYWNPSTAAAEPIHFAFFDAQGNRVTGFEGSTKNLKGGLFYQSFNAFSSEETLSAPRNLTASFRNNDVLLQWECADNPLSFFVYRDGLLYDVVHENSYLDADATGALHHYHITAFNGTVESDPSVACNIQAASSLPAPMNFRYEIVNQNKVNFLWDAPQTDETELYYNLYRRAPGEEFQVVKTLSSTHYNQTIISWEWGLYDMAVSALYPTGESAFAPIQADPSRYYLEVNKTEIPMHLGCDVMPEGVTLNWLPAIMANRYAVYRNGVLLSDQVTEPSYFDGTVQHGQAYRYQVVGMNDYLVSNPSNTAELDWASEQIDEAGQEGQVTVSPNPVADLLNVSAFGLREVSVYNQLGQRIRCQQTEGDVLRLDVNDLATGLYFLCVSTDSGATVVKFVKN